MEPIPDGDAPSQSPMSTSPSRRRRRFRVSAFMTLRRNISFIALLTFTLAISYANFFTRDSEPNTPLDSPTTPNTPTSHPPPKTILTPLIFRDDGLVEVNYNSRHPIYDLIDKAKSDWNNKLARQSKSLREACLEYKRRYKREPPPGFDKWSV
jgi:hypothetical protein